MKKNCIICLGNIKTKKSLTILRDTFETDCKCNYYYHNRCIKRWWNRNYRKSCPICRNYIYNSYLSRYLNEYSEFFSKIVNIMLFMFVKYLHFLKMLLITIFVLSPYNEFLHIFVILFTLISIIKSTIYGILIRLFIDVILLSFLLFNHKEFEIIYLFFKTGGLVLVGRLSI